ncbi:MAG TPA: nucleotidyltransferase domain-containing protein [Spirochaetota bacterium]|nr:nucleotidyltransferase domain-containing protein [Spirochaetota bacterium]HPO46195.1 nucleotidyltransferase domain-containing protein [Spirochaetota bacterium]HPV98661.1 nucleotidyltransferase domain-containing protein [Spirochaetota bacterium]
MMRLSDKERMAIKELKDFISSRYTLMEFKLYGSKARGDNSPESDIDIMVTLRETGPKTENDIYDRAIALNILHDVLISVVIFSEEELTAGPMRESPLYRIIEKEGVAV